MDRALIIGEVIAEAKAELVKIQLQLSHGYTAELLDLEKRKLAAIDGLEQLLNQV